MRGTIMPCTPRPAPLLARPSWARRSVRTAPLPPCPPPHPPARPRTGPRVPALPFDPQDGAARATALQPLQAQSGRLDILVNNVGQRDRRALDAFALDDIRRLLDINLVA